MDRHSVDWKGYIPAVTTPFDADLRFDPVAQRAMTDWYLQEGLHGIIIGGTTGEWFSMSNEERAQQFQVVGDALKGKMTLIAGCNSYTADAAIELSKAAKQAGFDGILVTPPPYVVPNDDELVTFYQAVSDGSELPICVYNWPRGIALDLSIEVLDRIADIDKVVAIKNSTGNFGQFVNGFFALREKVRYFGFPTNEAGISMVGKEGGDGLMGAGAVLGRNHPEFFNAVWRGDLDKAREVGVMDRVIMTELFTPNYSSAFGSAQAVFKTALNLQGLPAGPVRPPLMNLDEAQVDRVRQVLVRLGRSVS